MTFTLTVTDLNDYVRRSLAGDPILQGLVLRGEISNLVRHTSGHYYFSLKDEKSRIACIMFRQYAQSVPFQMKDGMSVLLKGSVSLYVQSGTYQFYAESAELDGMGALYLRFEQLKLELSKEGLFDVSKKRPLPLLPRAIGIVTAKTGAVIHDIQNVTRNRNSSVQLILRPTLVQGEGAKEDIVKGIEALSKLEQVDVIIVGRGGGSLEDLWAFNEECVVRAIAQCPVPVISAVGHETDVTLSDFAADMRASTPSHAAEIAVTHKDTLKSMVFEQQAQLYKSTYDLIIQKKFEIESLEKRLALCHPALKLKKMQHDLALLKEHLVYALQNTLQKHVQKVQVLSQKLDTLSPYGALKRGYTMTMSQGKVATSVQDLTEKATIVFYDGEAEVQVVQKTGGKENAT